MVEIDAKAFLKIMENNTNFEVVEIFCGEAVLMNSYEAFIYSTVTGSPYLDDNLLPFSPKGLTKVFYNAFDYKFVTGLFDNTRLLYTPLSLNAKHPYISDGYKYIVPLEFNSEYEYAQKINSIITDSKFFGFNPENIIIQRIELSKKGNGMEPFCEYIVSDYFKRKGFIVETQIPLSHQAGSPDFGGYSLNNILIKEPSSDFISSGFHIIELSMLRLFKSSLFSNLKNNRIETLVVGEAKTSTKIMEKQLTKYLDTGLFDKGYEIHPFKKRASNQTLGLISFDQNFKMFITEPLIEYQSSSELYNKNDYIIWLNNYIKYYLIANLTNDELITFYKVTTGKSLDNPNLLSEFINYLNIDEILNFINLKMEEM